MAKYALRLLAYGPTSEGVNHIEAHIEAVERAVGDFDEFKPSGILPSRDRFNFLFGTVFNGLWEFVQQDDDALTEDNMQQILEAVEELSVVFQRFPENLDDLPDMFKFFLPRNMVMIYPADGSCYLQKSISDHAHKIVYESLLDEIDEEVKRRLYIICDLNTPESEGYDRLTLVLGSLRQQLGQMVGFRCPLLEPGSIECQCTHMPEFKEWLARLCRWAIADNHFGPGEWTDLPFPCGRSS